MATTRTLNDLADFSAWLGTQEICERCANLINRVADPAEIHVARLAQESANPTAGVAVVNDKIPLRFADPAASPLMFQKSRLYAWGETIGVLSVSRASAHLMSFSTAFFTRSVSVTPRVLAALRHLACVGRSTRRFKTGVPPVVTGRPGFFLETFFFAILCLYGNG